MAHHSITSRARIYLAAAAVAVVVTAVALPLALRARADHRAATRLVTDDLVLVNSVAEARALTLQLQLSVARAVLTPQDTGPAQRFRSDRVRLADELRRARLHADSPNTVDVVDDLENRTLAFSEAAAKVFAAADGRPEEAQAGLAALAQDSGRINELADELTTVAATAADRHGRRVSGGPRTLGLLVLALAGLVLAVQGGALAATESAPALAATLRRAAPPAVYRYLSDRDRPAEPRAGVPAGLGTVEPAIAASTFASTEPAPMRRPQPQPATPAAPESSAAAVAAAELPDGSDTDAGMDTMPVPITPQPV